MIDYLLRAYELNPYDPYICVMITQAFFGRSMNRQSDNRNYQIAQVSPGFSPFPPTISFLSLFPTLSTMMGGDSLGERFTHDLRHVWLSALLPGERASNHTTLHRRHCGSTI